MLGLWKQLRGSLDARSSGKSGGHESGIPACKDCPKTRLAHLANERSPRETAKSQATGGARRMNELETEKYQGHDSAMAWTPPPERVGLVTLIARIFAEASSKRSEERRVGKDWSTRL